MRVYGEIIPYLTNTIISNVALSHYGISPAKDLVSVECGTSLFNRIRSSFDNT